MREHATSNRLAVDQPTRGADRNRSLADQADPATDEMLLPQLDDGITLLDVEGGRGVPILQSLVLDHLLLHDGPAFWVDANGHATTTTLAQIAPSQRLLNRIHVARGFTPYQHYGAVCDLPTAVNNSIQTSTADIPLIRCLTLCPQPHRVWRPLLSSPKRCTRGFILSATDSNVEISQMTASCEFAYSLTDKEPVARNQIGPDEDDAGDVWHCPHAPMAESTYCPFHAPVERTDPMVVATAVEELMTGDVDAPPELIGAELSTLDLSGTVIDHGATPVDLRDIVVKGELRFEYTDIRSPLRLTNASIEADLTLDSATIAGDLNLNQASIGGNLSAEGAELGSVTANRVDLRGDIHLDDIRVNNQFLLWETALGGALRVQSGTFDGLLALTRVSFGHTVDFESTTFGGRVDLQASAFEAEVGFRDVTFDRSLLLEEAAFYAPVRFDGATFARSVAIPEAMFRDEVSFTGAQFDAGLQLAQSQFNAPVRFDGAVFDGVFAADRAAFLEQVQFAGVTFDAAATFDETAFDSTVGFTDATFTADASFDSTVFNDEVDFETAVFRGELIFAPAVTDHTEPRVFDLRGAELRAGKLATPGKDDVIDLTNATLGDVTLIGDSDTSLEQFRIVNVRFDRFDFTEKRFRDQLAADGWTLHTTLKDDIGQSLVQRVYNRTLGRLLMTAPPAVQTPAADNRDLETTYLRAKNGADDDGYTTGAAEFFINEKVYRRRTYLDGTASTNSRLAAGINYLANMGLAVTTGYGERPFRPVFASLLTIGLYALAYLLLFDPPLLSGANLWEHVLFSGQNFVAFVIGPPPEQSGSLLFRLTTALEAFTGAFFVALFVFSLTRSIDR